jgi:hypothetical protein
VTQQFTAKTPYVAEHPHALAFYCSDGRFTEPVEELLRSLGHARLDTLTMPGGPGLLSMTTAKFGDLDAARRGAGFLIAGHAIREVVLIAHQGCGYYRARLAGRAAEAIEKAQLADLEVAARELVRAHPLLVAHRYYARVVDGRVRFERVA